MLIEEVRKISFIAVFALARPQLLDLIMNFNLNQYFTLKSGKMGASTSHPAYITPASPPLLPPVLAHLQSRGALFNIAVRYAPLAFMRSTYDREGEGSYGTVLQQDTQSRDISLQAADGVTQLRCRLHSPSKLAQADVSPLVFYVHGGGWAMGSVASHSSACRFIAAESGLRVLAVQYRRAPEVRYPAAQDDVFSLYRQVCARPADFGLDASNPRIILCGDSAGGQLVIGLACTIKDSNRGATTVRAPDVAAAPGPLPQPALLVPLYPVINRFREWQSVSRFCSSAGGRRSNALLRRTFR